MTVKKVFEEVLKESNHNVSTEEKRVWLWARDVVSNALEKLKDVRDQVESLDEGFIDEDLGEGISSITSALISIKNKF